MNDLLNSMNNDVPEHGPTEAAPSKRTRRRKPMKKAKGKPTHYKVICISMYTRDLDALDAKVAELKRRGFTKANKSQLIRLALSQIDVDGLGAASRESDLEAPQSEAA
jgi:hypothetical protein